MKILITGAGGFIGSHLTEFLVQQGFEVKAFVRYNSNNRWGWLEHSECIKDIEVITGDIRDYDSVFSAMKGCTGVFHLAALIGIPYSYISPLAYIKTNIQGTYNVLQSAKELNIDNILITSTSETYGTAKYVPIDEHHPCVGQSPYSATKIAADELAMSYFLSYNLPIKIVKPFNTFGPRQSARAIIPTLITQMLSGRVKIEVGNIEPTRDFTYVEDTAKGFFEIYKSDKFTGEVVNIGMNDEISVKELAFKISELMNKSIEIISKEERKRPLSSEVGRLRCDNTKLINNSNWKPDYDLQKGLLKTIHWYEKNLNLYKPEIYNV